MRRGLMATAVAVLLLALAPSAGQAWPQRGMSNHEARAHIRTYNVRNYGLRSWSMFDANNVRTTWCERSGDGFLCHERLRSRIHMVINGERHPALLAMDWNDLVLRTGFVEELG